MSSISAPLRFFDQVTKSSPVFPAMFVAGVVGSAERLGFIFDLRPGVTHDFLTHDDCLLGGAIKRASLGSCPAEYKAMGDE
jgi:hypothetical protein